MAVLFCKRMRQNATLSVDNKFRRTYKHDFHIQTDSASDYQPEVYNGAISASPDPLPQPWSLYEGYGSGTAVDDNFSTVQGIELKRKIDGEGCHFDWIATVTWSPPEPGSTSSDPPTINPLDRPIKYSMEWANYTRLVDKDIFGEPIVNSAGDGFDPPIEIDDARPVLVAVKNMWPLEDIIALSLAYKNAVNTDTFFDATARKAKVESIVSGQIMEENGIQFYAVTFRIQFNHEKWDIHLVDRGTQVLVADNVGTGFHKEFPRIPAGQANAGDPIDIVNLNADGTQRAQGQVALFKPPLASDGFRIYPELAFSGLGIGGA